MESISNGAKRKKRRTRKCLDEIRKRSRCSGQILFEKDGKLDEVCSKNIQRCMITNNRLTLRMFPKAIQSKTITRSTLLDLEHKPNLNLDELVKGSKVWHTQNNKRVKIPASDTDSNDDIFQNSSLTPGNCILQNSIIEEERLEQHSDDKNNEMFSSMDEVSNKSPNSIGTPLMSAMTSSSSTQSFHEDNGYSLYEEFMSEIPACLQHNSKLLQEDVMKKTKILLQNLFIESCYEECEDNILQCIKNDQPNRTYYTGREVVHNPMDYIRLGRAPAGGPGSGSGAGSGPGSCSGAGSGSGAGRSPASSGTSPSDAPVSVSVVIQDTPDYTYYPHRLN